MMNRRLNYLCLMPDLNPHQAKTQQPSISIMK